MRKILYTIIIASVTGLLSFTMQAQNQVSKSGFFKSLSLDPVMTLHNKSGTAIECITITYKIDGKQMRSYKFGGTLPANTSVDIPLPRMQVSGGMHFFDASAATKNGESLKNKTFAEGLSFTLSPGVKVISGVLNKENLEEVSDNAPKGCSCENGKGLDEDISFWFNIYVDDHLKIDAFGSIDHGKIWFQGKWDERAGLENEWNQAVFADPSNQYRTYKLTVSTEPVTENFTAYGISKNEANAINLNLFECKAYPNPFNNTVYIEYGINKPADIDIVISDITGKVIAYPVHSLTHGTGIYTYEYNAGNLPNGVYYCTIRSENTKQTLKLIKK